MITIASIFHWYYLPETLLRKLTTKVRTSDRASTWAGTSFCATGRGYLGIQDFQEVSRHPRHICNDTTDTDNNHADNFISTNHVSRIFVTMLLSFHTIFHGSWRREIRNFCTNHEFKKNKNGSIQPIILYRKS